MRLSGSVFPCAGSLAAHRSDPPEKFPAEVAIEADFVNVLSERVSAMTAVSIVPAIAIPDVTVQVTLGGPEVIQQWSDQWGGLCSECHAPPFYRPEWIATYLQAFAPNNHQIAIFTAHSSGKLVALLPMILKRTWYAGVPVTKLCGAANVHSVRYGMVRTSCPAGDAAVAAIWNLIKQTGDWHVAELPVFAEGSCCADILQLAQQDGYRTLRFLVQDSPVLYMTREKDGKLSWLAGTNRHFRHELRRFARLLEETAGGQPKLLRFDHPEPAVMKQFYELEAAGWKGQEGSAINCDPATRAFYDLIAQRATQGGYFSLHTLDVNGHMAAGAFSVFTGDSFHPMKIAHNEAWRRGGPGHLLFNGILEQCAAANIPEFFFGGSKDRYKTSWTEKSIPHYNGVIFAPGIRGELAFRMRTHVLSRLGQWRRDFRAWKASKKQAKPAISAAASADSKSTHKIEGEVQ